MSDKKYREENYQMREYESDIELDSDDEFSVASFGTNYHSDDSSYVSSSDIGSSESNYDELSADSISDSIQLGINRLNISRNSIPNEIGQQERTGTVSGAMERSRNNSMGLLSSMLEQLSGYRERLGEEQFNNVRGYATSRLREGIINDGGPSLLEAGTGGLNIAEQDLERRTRMSADASSARRSPLEDLISERRRYERARREGREENLISPRHVDHRVEEINATENSASEHRVAFEPRINNRITEDQIVFRERSGEPILFRSAVRRSQSSASMDSSSDESSISTSSFSSGGSNSNSSSNNSRSR